MEIKRKQPRKPKIVTKPYLTGAPVDKHIVLDALKFLGALIGTAVLFLVAGAVLMVENTLLRVVLNLAAMALVYAMFVISGMSKGTAAVNLGEMLYVRRENGREIPPKELQMCFHPLKGFITALAGSVPFVVCALLLTITAQLQQTVLSPLPSWISAISTREEIVDPLAYYAVQSPMTLETLVRMPIRMALMPLVSMIGSENASALLLLERVSPLLMLIPAVCYGAGYTRGVAARTKVHTSIAANNRKRAKREKKQVQARRERKPEQLN